jgi:hypothetical protein
MVGHLHLLKDFHIDDVEVSPSIDEGTIDNDVVDGRGAHSRDGAHGPSGDQVVFCIEGRAISALEHQRLAVLPRYPGTVA